MPGTNLELPKARIARRPRWYIKDKKFMNEIGGALAFFGIFLSIGIVAQRMAAEDAPTSPIIGIMFLITYGLTCASLMMAGQRLMWVDGPPKSFLRGFGRMMAYFLVMIAVVGSAAIGVFRLILPLQAIFAWLSLTVGFTLLIRTRPRKSDAA